ncbi:DUF445 family protein [Terrisporobacter mayombei]|uniref:DUF445 domain-containing protein n=1 Tax=Terrisporobacter mayombei TaxID=1541 RepID=A0ABY9Q5H2_9FIRM|nr:DUF445 family protein [Terrisporobacter mayombei]MCC3869469.1 DUF445 family protein [Terrisporobacter mayombei]WMT82300.1 hypothetical protein TEMA_26620 [Terrisporobacter mayombei]
MITLENGLFLLLQAFSSGVAGYITNKYAVNMIFKEYTPLKIGGVVKKNKEKFIEEISDLVERDIINSETLRDKVLGENFKLAMQDVGEDFFKESLCEVFENKKIEEIPSWNETLISGEEFLRDSLKEVLPRLITNIGENIKLEKLLSEKQRSHIVNCAYKEIIINIGYNDELKHLLSDLYEEQGEIYLSQLISKDSGEKVTRIISCEIMNSIDGLLDNKKETKLLVDKSLSLIDIKTLLKDLQKTIGTKTIDDILSEEEFEKLSLIVYEKLDELTKSEEGQEKLEDIVEEVFALAKDIDLTVFEILPIHFGRISSEYVADLIKKAIPYLSSWIGENKTKIENVIDESILESIDDIDDELRKSMISKVKDSMLLDFASKNQIVDKIVSFLEEYKISEEDSYKLYSKIIKFLEETKIKDLVVLLEENNLINEERVINIILEKWDTEGKELSKLFLKRQTSKNLNKLVDQDLNKLFNKNIKPKLYDLIMNNKAKIISYLDKTIFNLVHDKIEVLLNSKIKNLFNKDKVDGLSSLLSNKIVNILNKNHINYKKIINKEISDYIKNIKIQDLLSENEEKIINSITEKTVDFTKKEANKYKSYEVKDLLNKINSKEDLPEEISNKLYENIKDNLPTIVDKRVKKLIYDNLIKLDEEEICNIAQSFMGKQLKPLSMFGAFLGTIVGLIFGITMTNINGAYGFYNNVTNTLMACFLMGVVGIMTNVVALWMIFCPYEKNKFVSKIPLFRVFSIGYIPSHKNSFASGMAYFIDNELLSGNRVVDSFESQKNNFKNYIISNIKDSNYMAMLDFVRNRKHSLAKKTYGTILKLLKKNNNKMCNSIGNRLLDIECGRFVSIDFISNKANDLIEIISQKEDKIIEYLEEKLKTNKSLQEVLPEELITTVNNKIEEQVNDYINKNLENSYVEDVIKNIIFTNEKAYNYMMDKSIKDIISEKSLLSIQNSVKTDKFINITLLSLKEQLNNYLQDYLATEFTEEKKFDELFDGKVKEKLDNNIYNLTDMASEKLISYIKINDELISSTVIKIVRKNLNFFVKMAYDFADGDGLVKDVVNIVINNKIEKLILEDKDKLSIILNDYLGKEIYPSKVKDLGLKSTEINTSLLLDRLVFAMKQNEDFKNNMHSASDLVINNICEIKAKNISKIVGVNNLQETYDKYKEVINMASNKIIYNLNSNKEVADEFVRELIEEKVLKHFYSINLVEISWELNKDDLAYVVDNLLERINSSEVVNYHVLQICRSTYVSSIRNSKLSSVIDKDILESDMHDNLNLIIENKDLNHKNRVVVESIIDRLLDDKLNSITEEFKLYIINNIIDAGFNTIEKNIIPMLKSLDLQSITLEEVDKMHPKEIHELFKSFAGDFFIKLYIYGGFGLIFGINVYLSIVLFIIDIIYTKKIDSKVEESQYKLFRE